MHGKRQKLRSIRSHRSDGQAGTHPWTSRVARRMIRTDHRQIPESDFVVFIHPVQPDVHRTTGIGDIFRFPPGLKPVIGRSFDRNRLLPPAHQTGTLIGLDDQGTQTVAPAGLQDREIGFDLVSRSSGCPPVKFDTRPAFLGRDQRHHPGRCEQHQSKTRPTATGRAEHEVVPHV